MGHLPVTELGRLWLAKRSVCVLPASSISPVQILIPMLEHICTHTLLKSYNVNKLWILDGNKKVWICPSVHVVQASQRLA